MLSGLQFSMFLLSSFFEDFVFVSFQQENDIKKGSTLVEFKYLLFRSRMAYRNSWTLNARVGRWTLDAALWMLNSGFWTLDFGRWTLDSGRWTQDAQHQTVVVKTIKFKFVQSFGNNGSISITSFLNSTLIKIFGHFRYENLSTVYSFQITLSNNLKVSKT